MKYQDIKVTVPYITFEEMNNYKKKYDELRNRIIESTNTLNYDNNIDNHIIVSYEKIISIVKDCLGYKYPDASYIISSEGE